MHVGRAAWVQCKDDNHLHVIAKKPTNQKAQTNKNPFPKDAPLSLSPQGRQPVALTAVQRLIVHVNV
jgi:hypothetical protein